MTTTTRTHPTIADARAAAGRIHGYAVRTPLLESRAINEVAGGRVLIKAEPLQVTGAFKFRGAYNKISMLSEDQRRRGIIAYSSGNHAQGAAAAARMLGVNAIILMPEDAPAMKIRRTRSHGAEVRLYDRYTSKREEIAAGIIAESGRILIPPFDDFDIVAGQATIGLEISEQAAQAGATLDIALTCCGGGGLTAGVGMALKHLHPDIGFYAVEPEAFDDTRRSILSGRREDNAPNARSICDALQTQLGELTFDMNRHLLDGVFTVSDSEVQKAMAIAFEELKLVIEPGGAAALAAVLSGKLENRNRTVALVASGGNVDPQEFIRALSAT